MSRDGDGRERGKSPNEGAGTGSVNLVSTVANAAKKMFSWGGDGADETGGDRPREVRTKSDADWDMLDTPGDFDHPQKYKSHEEEIQKLRAYYDKCMTKNVTELSLKEEEVTKLKNELAKMRHQVGELSIKLQQRRPGDGVDSGAGSDVQRLQEHNKEQAQLVMKLKREKEELALKMKREQDEQSRHVMSLKGRIRELEETLEMTGSDKSSFGNMLQDIEDERDKVKDDFDNAKEEIRGLKVKVRQLEQELLVTKTETMSHTDEESATGDCINPKCKQVRTKLNQLEDQHGQKGDRVAQLERIVANLKEQKQVLEVAKNEAVGDIAAAKMEAEIYKADFLEERKDREKARGDLAELEKKTGGQSTYFNEERAELYKQINAYKQQVSKLRTEHARREATLKTELESARLAAGNFAKQIEAMSNELDDVKRERDRLERDKMKHEVERRKTSKHYKIKEYDRLKKQLHEASKGNVKLVDQVEGLRKHNKDLSKMIKKEQDRLRKAEKKTKASTTEVEDSETMTEKLESLESQIAELKSDVRHYQKVIETLKMGIRDGTVLFSPTDDEKSLVSPTTDQQVNTDTQSNPFQGDPDYIASECDPNLQPEIGLREQLSKLDHQHKQMAPMQRPFEAGKGDFQQRKTEPVQAPSNQEMDRGFQPTAGAWTSDQQFYNNRQQQGAQQSNTQPPRPQTLEGNSQGANRRGSSSYQSPVGPPSTGSAAERNKPFRAGVQGVQGQPPPSSNQHRPPLKNQSSQDSDLLTANRSPVLARQSSREPPILRARGPSSEPPIKAGGPSGPNQSQIRVADKPPPHPHSGLVQPNRHQYDNLTGQFQNAPPHRSAPHNIGGQQHMSEGAQGDRRAQVQLPAHTSAGGQQYPSEHAQTHPVANPPAAVVQSPQEDVGYMNISAGARDYGNRSAPIDRQGGQPPPSHMASAQSQQQYNTESERPAAYGGPGGGKPHVPQAEPLSRRQLHANEPEQFKGINYPALPPEAGTVETQSMGTQMSIPYTHPLTEKPPAGHGAKAKAVKRRGEAERENVLVEKIDTDISDMAAGVREEVSEENERIMTMEHKPYDPNLVCPMCGKKHRIGEIQKFRAHVDSCLGGEDGGAQSPPRITSV